MAPRAVIDAVAELIEIVEVVLPLLVDHADRDLGQRLVGQVVDPDPAPRIPEIVEFRLERLATRFLRRTHEIGPVFDDRGIGHGGNRDQELLQEFGFDQRAVPLRGIVVLGGQPIGKLLYRVVDHPLRLGLQLLAALDRVEPLRVNDFALLIHHVVEL